MSREGLKNGKAAGAIRLLDRATVAGWHLSGLALFLMLVSYVYEVTVRYFFNSPTSWSSDAIQWFLAALVMLALPEVTRQKSHITIAFLLENMSGDKRRYWERIVALLGAIICLFTAWICFKASLHQYKTGIETLWNHPIPKWWISIFLPYGFFMSAMQMLRLSLTNVEE